MLKRLKMVVISQHYNRASMTDRQTIKGFALTSGALLLLLIISLFLEENNRDIFLKEGGVVESVSALGYLLCAAFIVYKGKLIYLKRYYYLFLLIIFFMLRELDFDKRFTTMGILKSKFFISNDVPWVEKIVGAMVIALLLFIVFSILYRHSKDFYYGLKKHSVISFGALIVAILLGVSKSLDGTARKLNQFGVEIGEKTSMHVSALEEILELGIPIILLLTFSAYFERGKR